MIHHGLSQLNRNSPFMLCNLQQSREVSTPARRMNATQHMVRSRALEISTSCLLLKICNFRNLTTCQTENLIFRFGGRYLTNSTTEKALCFFGGCVLGRTSIRLLQGRGDTQTTRMESHKHVPKGSTFTEMQMFESRPQLQRNLNRIIRTRTCCCIRSMNTPQVCTC